MRRTFLSALLLGSFLPGVAQMHKVAKPEQVVRAVGVYEWTGDLQKPNASRLVPVTLFIDGALEDAGVYLPRPIPFALTPGNVYELEAAGLPKGVLDLAYARHLQTVDAAFEDGWFGYGSYKAPPPEKKPAPLRASHNPAVITSSKDDGRPHFGSKGEGGSKGDADPAQAGKDSQTAPDSADASGQSSKGAGADDPDRPTMRRRGSSSDDKPAETSTPGGSANPVDDADRPTLRRRSPEDAKKGKQGKDDVASVTSTGSLNNDPDRPNLHRGRASTANDTDIPKLAGLPKDLRQMVAISDAVNRPVHDFARPWGNDKERAEVLAKMQALAREQLLAYAANPLAAQGTTGQPKPAAAGQRTAARRAGARPPAKAAGPAPPQLLDEDLRGYTLSYGGAATFVYTAHTAGTGADLRYVTVVAQADVSGDLRPAVRSATDEAHLDRMPQMRFVDVVDAEASNRASLLFELRAQRARQFALYRVIGSRAETIFTTGTTQ